MTPREFFYPKLELDFYQSMTTRGVPSPTSIHFTIDRRHGILEARDIAEALQIPFKPIDPSAFRQWSPISQRDMVCILSKGTFTDLILLRKKLPPGMLLVDGATFQPLSLTAFGIEVMSYLGCFVPHIKGLLLWPTPLDHGLPHPL